MIVINVTPLRLYTNPRTQSLHNKRVLSLDLAALLAGTGIRGQFEEKFKALLRDIEEEHGGVICFIDELRKSVYESFALQLIYRLVS
jgi:ATP-dependent Clp protease ATP-binding subunit ClpA